MIGVSAWLGRTGATGGSEQATYGYIRGLEHATRPGSVIRVFSSRPLPLTFSDKIEAVCHPGRFSNRFLWESFDLPAMSRGSGPLLCPKYFTPPTFPGRRKVTVVHDLQHRHLPANFTAQKRAWLDFAHRATLRLADVVVTVSAFTRDDLVRSYGDRFAPKIVVIPGPIHWDGLSLARATRPAIATAIENAPFVLGVSAQWAHKNFETLIRGFAAARSKRPELKLVLVGESSRVLYSDRRRIVSPAQIIKELGLEAHVMETGYIAESELAWLYDKARLLVFPSLFEGHGRPATEAIGLGLPVLAARLTAIPESTQNLATFLDDPLSVGEMAARIVEMTDAPERFAPPADAAARLRSDFSAETLGPRLMKLLLAG